MGTDRATRTDRLSVRFDDQAVGADRVCEFVEAGLQARLLQVRRRWDDLTLNNGLGGRISTHLVEDLISFTREGGKRVRPRMCYWGWLAAGACSGLDHVVHTGIALELLHTFGLVQDDVMDESATRRGRRATHVELSNRHRRTAAQGSPDRFGESVAVLISDLALSEAYGLVMTLPEPVRVLWQEMTLELIAGQSLDLIGAAVDDVGFEHAVAIARAKSGHYTVTRPLQLGALATGEADPDVLVALESFGAHAGLAFALRDDLMSVAGDPARTGKPIADDLRDRKPTVLRALAAEAGVDLSWGPDGPLGRARGVEDVVAELTRCGVLGRVEQMIEDELAAADAVLDSGVFDSRAIDGLRRCAQRLGRRQA